MNAISALPAAARHKLFLSLASSMTELVVLVDDKRVILYANHAACILSGRKEKELAGAKFSELFRKGFELKYTAAIQSGLLARGKWRGEAELRSKDGSSLWAELSVEAIRAADGTLAGALCVGRDLTAERRQLQHSWEREGELLSICESMEDGVIVCDAKGTVVMCNAAFARHIGYRVEDVVGSSLPYGWTDSGDAQKLKQAFRLFGKEKSLKNHLVAFRRRDGSTMAASLTFSTLRKGGVDTSQRIVVMRDVTDVEYVQEVRRSSDQLYRLQLDVRRKAQRLQTLQDINAFVLTNADTDRIFRAITDGIKNLVGHDLAGIYLYDPEREEFFAHTLSKKTPFSRRLAKFPLPLGEGIIGEAAVSGKMVWVNNAQLDPRSRYPEGMRPEKEHFIAVPLKGRVSTFGILVVARNRNPEFIEEEAHIVKSFADAATVALENAQLHHALGTQQESARSAPAGRGARSPAALSPRSGSVARSPGESRRVRQQTNRL